MTSISHPVNHSYRFLFSPRQLFPAITYSWIIRYPESHCVLSRPFNITRFSSSLPIQLSILDTMSRQRRHTISGPRPSTQDIFAAGPRESSANCDPGSLSRGNLSQASHEVVDAMTQTSDHMADIADMPPLTGADSDAEDVSTVAQSRSDRLEVPGLIEAFTQLETGDESRPNPGSVAPSLTVPIPVSDRGQYELFEHVPRQTIAELMRDIPRTSFDAFVGHLVQLGLLNWEDDDLPIKPATRVAIMALTFQQLASPANLNLPPDVVERFVPMFILPRIVATDVIIFQDLHRRLQSHRYTVWFRCSTMDLGRRHETTWSQRHVSRMDSSLAPRKKTSIWCFRAASLWTDTCTYRDNIDVKR
ncbi:uncharacterized protein B0T23DRAFT_380214 [Neurospora hispaniola]|uniref:Uncharacterized protein n=1 Tax=Neurospora hispaniola TaxID=588809 RepID=A0AAJ0I835_9PEZI|nr:hypothetical protein B0T23DRAFT_380214 [Neurospora hispaniola]